MNKICIDARMWGIKHTGIGRYVENLIDNLPSDVVLILHPENRDEPTLKRFQKYYASFHPYSYLAQFEMFFLLIKIQPKLLHVPHFTVPLLWWGKMVVTIHDLIKHLSKGSSTTTRHPLIYWVKYLQYLFIVWFAVNRADYIIVPAEYWKNILIEKYKLDAGKVSVTYEGVSDSLYR
ncbi:glycosyltransferase [Candidatus Amesbacteria bacterium]|nr:glycosyltransferase [Candidatus Amesbacteria bacterium]